MIREKALALTENNRSDHRQQQDCLARDERHPQYAVEAVSIYHLPRKKTSNSLPGSP